MSTPKPPRRFTAGIRQLVPLVTILAPDIDTPPEGLVIVRGLKADDDAVAELAIARVSYERAIRRLTTSLASWQSPPIPPFLNDGSNGNPPWILEK